MKLSKKIMAMLMVTALMFVATGKADSLGLQQPEVAKALKAYQQNLRHHNDGIVESAMLQIMILKRYYPTFDYAAANHDLNKILQTSTNQRLRNRAFIVSSYLVQPESFPWLQNAELQSYRETQELLFQYIEDLDWQLSQNDQISR